MSRPSMPGRPGRPGRPADAAVWFRRYQRPGGPPARLRLVCFPHAGGTAQLYHGWAALLPAGVELLAVRYPGRQERLAEPCFEDMDALVDAVTGALGDFLDQPLALFGHSMGASVAYESTLRLQERYGVRPIRLMVSGRSAPHRPKPSRLHEQDDETLIAGVRRLGDLGSEAYDIPELRELLLPALRADFRLIEAYRPARPAPVSCPVTAYVGDGDPGCVRDDVLAWSDLTPPGAFDFRTYPGDHFYLARQEAALVADVIKDLEA
ncbi:thioesterase II family protein [Streptomyces sp. AP-93]|uniref:thioesterase II family protein n=1 Tax=Streptomyces sp. AP-93 TaxID=2929048 RepID=UPI001FAF3740|nr:alpha/beta fold hydrolase [Streptomyces sp. AP-93]MCJ0871768.1 thioesterase domain-containing protein [Streptomyces sp. AP-93]